MLESGKIQFIDKKSYEISYALWRVAAHVQEKALAAHLFDKAIELVVLAADRDEESMAKIANALQMVIKFAVDINCISVSNAVILAREIGSLQAIIEKPKKNAENDKGTDIDISDIFSTDPAPSEEPSELLMQDSDVIEETKFENLPDMAENGNFAAIESAGDNGNKAAIRQSTILDKIRQTGNCRLGDIQAILPGSSERTIRYDLESLVRRNLIERIGIGGRSVYYRPK